MIASSEIELKYLALHVEDNDNRIATNDGLQTFLSNWPIDVKPLFSKEEIQYGHGSLIL